MPANAALSQQIPKDFNIIKHGRSELSIVPLATMRATYAVVSPVATRNILTAAVKKRPIDGGGG
jgi:hypothetical protein